MRAVQASGFTDATLTLRTGYSTSALLRNLLDGGASFTIRQYGKVLAACGYEVRFRLVKRKKGTA